MNGGTEYSRCHPGLPDSRQARWCSFVHRNHTCVYSFTSRTRRFVSHRAAGVQLLGRDAALGEPDRRPSANRAEALPSTAAEATRETYRSAPDVTARSRCRRVRGLVPVSSGSLPSRHGPYPASSASPQVSKSPQVSNRRSRPPKGLDGAGAVGLGVDGVAMMAPPPSRRSRHHHLHEFVGQCPGEASREQVVLRSSVDTHAATVVLLVHARARTPGRTGVTATPELPNPRRMLKCPFVAIRAVRSGRAQPLRD